MDRTIAKRLSSLRRLCRRRPWFEPRRSRFRCSATRTAPTRLARLKRHVKDAGDKEDGGGVLAATLGVAVHPAGHVVVTCGADGTLLVSPANAFADPTGAYL
jgi:hypothetical protein